MGPCSRGPLLRVVRGEQEDIYEHVTPEQAIEIVVSYIYDNIDGRDRIAPLPKDMPFFQAQEKIVLSNNGTLDPEKIEQSIAAGSYRALAHALHEMTPEEGLQRDQDQRPARAGGRWLSDRRQVEPGAQVTRRA